MTHHFLGVRPLGLELEIGAARHGLPGDAVAGRDHQRVAPRSEGSQREKAIQGYLLPGLADGVGRFARFPYLFAFSEQPVGDQDARGTQRSIGSQIVELQKETELF